MPHTMPANLLGGDMLWWREGAGVHTLVTLAWELAGLTGPKALELHFVLHDETGEEVHRWTRSYSPGDVIIVDSARVCGAPSTSWPSSTCMRAASHPRPAGSRSMTSPHPRTRHNV